jgi:metal-sulfur cluster biosynthetic enzyme
MANPKIEPVPAEKRTGKHWLLLNNIFDPEIGIGLVDLGLIYNIEIKKDKIIVTMTLTSMGCPFGASIVEQIKDEMGNLPKIKKVEVNIVWDPIWTADKINPDIRSVLSL